MPDPNQLSNEDYPTPGDRSPQPTQFSPKDVKPVEDVNALENIDEDKANGDPSPANLMRMTRFHPFWNYFTYIAIRRFPRKRSKRACVEALRIESPRLYWACVSLDVGLTLALVLMLLVVLAIGIYKTTWLPV